MANPRPAATACLRTPRVEVTVLPYAASEHNPDAENALWVRLGDLNLHPVENGVSDVLVKANQLIRPIRCDELQRRFAP